MGLEDVKDRIDAGGARWKVEDEVVIVFAEYFDALNDSWGMEFRGQSNGRTGEYAVFFYGYYLKFESDKEELLYIASYVLPMVSETKFRVLDLPV